MFTPEQKKALEADLLRSNVKTREQSGMKLSYIEGWHAIAEANRIFGFDGWSSETVETKCVAEAPRKVGQGDGFGVTYTCRVRITVGDGALHRDGTGTGHGVSRSLGDAHESAIKEAETDARKRALMTFGNQFGLALYDKAQENVEDDTRPAPRPPQQPAQKASYEAQKVASQPPPKMTPAQYADKCVREIGSFRDMEDAKAWRAARADALHKLDHEHPDLYDKVMKVLNTTEGAFKTRTAA